MRLVFSRCAPAQCHLTWELKQNTCEPCNASTMSNKYIYIERDNRCMYMAHICFYVCSSDCVGVCENVCCVAAIVKIVFLALECCMLCVVDVMDIVFSVLYCIVRRGAVYARVWEV